VTYIGNNVSLLESGELIIMAQSLESNVLHAPEAQPKTDASLSANPGSSQPVRIELDVTLQSESNFYMGLTERLPSAGLFIATHMVRPVGTQVHVALRLAVSDRLVHARGVVRWIREFSERTEAPPGMGVWFEILDAEDMAAIEEFLKLRTPLFFE